MNQILSSKYILPFFSVAVVAIVVVIGAVFLLNQGSEPQPTPNPSTPSPSPTPSPQPAVEVPDDWLTYRNEEFGFEVKYPQGWIFVSSQPEAIINNLKLIVGFRHPMNSEGFTNIFIMVSDLVQPLSELYGHRTLETMNAEGPFMITDGRKIKIGETEGYYFKDATGPWPFDVVYIPHKSILIRIDAYRDPWGSPIDTDFRTLFYQILSTFHFVGE